MQPTAPDPYEVADAQSGANRDAALYGSLLNNFNETNPFGSVNYSQIGTQFYTDAQGNRIEVPRFQRDVTLSPEQQQLYDQQVQAGQGLNDLAISQIGRLNTSLNTPFSLSGLPPATTSINKDWSADRARVEDAIFGRVNEQFDRDEGLLRQRLASQGLTPGSEAYNAEIDRLNQGRSAARTDAVLAGGGEQSRLAGLDLAAGQFGNQTRQQLLAELLAERNQPVNEVSALLSGGQVTAPQFQGYYQQGVGPPPVGDYIYQDYNTRVQQQQDRQSGLFGLLGTVLSGALALSDERAKTDIKKVGKTDAGTPVYTYRYKAGGPTQMGVMAQQVAETQPEAVGIMPSGLFGVDYSKVA